MAPQSGNEISAKTSDGRMVPVNDGIVPLEPGIRKSIAENAMPKFPGPPTFEDKFKEREYLKGRLAAAWRIFGKFGFDEGVAGHITLRDPVDPDCFWVNPFGVAFSLMKKSDLILVNHAGEVFDGGECRLLNTAAFMIHSAIHAARPDVICAAHSHSIYGRTWCSLGREIDTLTQDSCAFYNDHVVFDSFNGVVLAEKEGKDIAQCLGNKKAGLLQNHGLLTVGKSVEETIFWFVSLEKCCQSQLMAEAAALPGERPIKIGDEEAAYTYRTVGSTLAGWFSGKPLFDFIHRETNGDYLQ
ncbi:probable class II aldolase/adducin domain protein [Ramularia collo-cygni]|uniref:Probable class II aldolase/adducin domain protein n=1 Tax=Ramularia collo-cygni TaxID=112498 RepID=A0A2D3V8R0_9PEZI|nr:probable class II aldolase/adducin domain protein [Ramularia collo-cygni]CZT24393.1 probable class II aldolase/adducin domain protein [Ramularia collo-cygni]